MYSYIDLKNRSAYLQLPKRSLFSDESTTVQNALTNKTIRDLFMAMVHTNATIINGGSHV